MFRELFERKALTIREVKLILGGKKGITIEEKGDQAVISTTLKYPIDLKKKIQTLLKIDFKQAVGDFGDGEVYRGGGLELYISDFNGVITAKIYKEK